LFVSGSLLAFGFASPWLLWGLGAAAAPILIHLLSRRRHRETEWAAMRFLVEALRKNARRMRLEQWILLLVRTLILLLVALALARPTIDAFGGLFAGSAPVHRILVVDASLSMQARLTDDGSVFDAAKGIAGTILDQASPGDAWNLVRMTRAAPQVIVGTPSFQAAAVRAELEAMSASHASADLAATLETVVGLAGALPEMTRKEVVFLADFQSATWLPESAAHGARVKESLRQLAEKAKIVLLDAGRGELSNLAVTRFEAIDPLSVLGRSARYRFTVRNHSTLAVNDLPVELLVDGKVAERKQLAIPAGGEASEAFNHLFTTGGEHRLVARLPNDALPQDDARQLAPRVKDRLRLLLVEGRPASGSRPGSAMFVDLALFPRSGAAAPGRPGLVTEPTVIAEGEFSGADLARFDAVFLCDIPTFTDAEVRRLESYARAGGGVVFCVGERVQAARWNDSLYRAGRGLLPAELGERVGQLDGRGETFDFRVDDYSHPVVNVFEGNPDAGLETTRTFAYHKVRLLPTSGATVPLRFGSGDPAIIERAWGAGRVLLITTSVDGSWGVWPMWPSFLPMMQEIAFHASTARRETREGLVAEPIQRSIRTGGLEVSGSILRPDGQSRPVVMETGEGTDDGLATYRYDDTDLVGFYEVTFTGVGVAKELHAVNPDPRESDPARLSRQALEEDVFAGIDARYLTQWDGRSSTELGAAVAAPATTSLAKWLLYAALYLLLVEQLLAWNFAVGQWFLFPPLLAVGALRAWRRRNVLKG
jgi:hypothetical protein